MKRRLSASIDDDLLTAAEAAVRDGHAPSVSALVEEALRIQIERTRKLGAMDELFELLDERRGAPMSLDEARRFADEARASTIWPAGSSGHRSSEAA